DNTGERARRRGGAVPADVEGGEPDALAVGPRAEVGQPGPVAQRQVRPDLPGVLGVELPPVPADVVEGVFRLLLVVVGAAEEQVAERVPGRAAGPGVQLQVAIAVAVAGLIVRDP